MMPRRLVIRRGIEALLLLAWNFGFGLRSALGRRGRCGALGWSSRSGTLGRCSALCGFGTVSRSCGSVLGLLALALLCRLIEERLTGVAQFVLVLQKAVARLSASRLKVFTEFLPIFLADGARFCRVGGGGQSRHAKNGNHGQQDEVLHHSCELQGSENRWCIVKPAIGQQAPKVNKSRLPGARTL